MDNIIIRNRKEEFKELVLYTFFGNMTFVISIGSYAIFNVFFGINELIAQRNGMGVCCSFFICYQQEVGV